MSKQVKPAASRPATVCVPFALLLKLKDQTGPVREKGGHQFLYDAEVYGSTELTDKEADWLVAHGWSHW